MMANLKTLGFFGAFGVFSRHTRLLPTLTRDAAHSS